MINKRDPILIQMPEELHNAIGLFLTKYPFVPFSSFTKTMVEEIVNKPDVELIPFLRDKYLKLPREIKPICAMTATASDDIRRRCKHLSTLAGRYRASGAVSIAALARYAWRMIIALPEASQMSLLKKYFPNQSKRVPRRNKHEAPSTEPVFLIPTQSIIGPRFLTRDGAGEYIPLQTGSD